MRVADRTVVLPLLSVVETVFPTPGQMVRIAGSGELLLLRGESIPLLRLRRFLGIAAHAAADETDLSNRIQQRELVVVLETGMKKFGLVIDELMGQQQVVVKSLERHLHRVDGLMGATILGDGCVAPIIDVGGLCGLDMFSLRAQPMDASHGRLVHSLDTMALATTNRRVAAMH